VAQRRAWLAAVSGDVDTAARQIEAGLEHAERALAVSPRDAPALAERGSLKVLNILALSPTRDELSRLMEEARADLESATTEDPGLASAHSMLSFLYAGMEDWVQTVLSARRALEEDAYLREADRIYDRLAFGQYYLEQFRDARNWCEEGRRRFPDDPRFIECQLWLMAAPTGEADVDEAWALAAHMDSISPQSLRGFNHSLGQILVAGVLRLAALPDSAERVLERVDTGADIDPERGLHVYVAAIRATTGDPEGALTSLRQWAAETPGSTLGPGAERLWWWRELRTRPEFQPFVNRGN
jgi:serine/threonine-protein kinase